MEKGGALSLPILLERVRLQFTYVHPSLSYMDEYVGMIGARDANLSKCACGKEHVAISFNTADSTFLHITNARHSAVEDDIQDRSALRFPPPQGGR